MVRFLFQGQQMQLKMAEVIMHVAFLFSFSFFFFVLFCYFLLHVFILIGKNSSIKTAPNFLLRMSKFLLTMWLRNLLPGQLESQQYFVYSCDIIRFATNAWKRNLKKRQLNSNMLSLAGLQKLHAVKLFKIVDFQLAHIKSFHTKCQMLQTAL